MFYAAAQQTVINFFDDYYKIASKAKLIWEIYMKKREISSIRNILSRIEYREYSVLGIQDYFECIIKIHETVADNPLKRIYVNITGNNRK